MSEITSAICVQGLKFSRDGSEFYGGGGLNFELNLAKFWLFWDKMELEKLRF